MELFPVKYTTCDRFHWNDCDVCLNPEVMSLVAVNGGYGYSVTIKWAECGNGLWAYGIDYNTGTGGGGFGVSFADKPFKEGEKPDYRTGYPTEKDCKIAACKRAIKLVKNSGYWNTEEGDSRRINTDRLLKMIDDYMESINPKYVQLELFADL